MWAALTEGEAPGDVSKGGTAPRAVEAMPVETRLPEFGLEMIVEMEIGRAHV